MAKLRPEWSGGRSWAGHHRSKLRRCGIGSANSALRDIGDVYIYDDSDAERLKHEIVLVDVRNPAAQMIVPSPQTRMTPLSAIRRSLELRILEHPGWSQEEKTALIEAMAPLIRPNVVLDQTATASAREIEANKIEQVPGFCLKETRSSRARATQLRRE